MTHSKVFADQGTDGWFVTLVAHPEDAQMEDWLLSEENFETIRHYGLFEYSLDTNSGMFYIYDPIEAEMYEPTAETWEGVDADAVESLYNAANLGLFEPIGEEYLEIQRRYLSNVDDPLGALDGSSAVHAVGTIVRIEVGAEGYALVKVGENAWEINGGSGLWSDAEVVSDDFEVIWNA